jgi:DNA-directed RNA polymerase alpha subunit
MEINIEKVLFPLSGKLTQDDDGNIQMKIVDAELDEFICDFNNDECVEIDTSNHQWITLSVENLHQLINAIEQAEIMANGIKASTFTKKLWSDINDSIDLRLYNAIRNSMWEGDFYINQLSDKELLKFRNFGVKCLERLKQRLKEM